MRRHGADTAGDRVWRHGVATAAALLALFAPGVSPGATADRHVLVLLDLSASMNEKMPGGLTRMEAARRVFAEVFAGIGPDTALGLRVFADGEARDRAAACRESTLVVPFGAANRTLISNIVNQASPRGAKTPLAFALERAREDLEGLAGARKIVLLSDGQENCEGDPEALAEAIFQQGVPIDTIGIGPAGGFEQLGGIALNGGGKFFLGENLASLERALRLAVGSGQPPAAPPRASPPVAPRGAPPALQVPGSPLVRVIPLPPDDEGEKLFEDPPQVAVTGAPTGPVLHLELILDASGSMGKKLGGKTKMALAKTALAETVSALDSEFIALALRAYGFDRTIEKTRAKSCENTELLLGFGEAGPGKIVDRVRALSEYGYTPIAKSLRLAGDDLLPFKDRHPTILLISDGEETCNGDPVAEIERLRERGIDVRVHVIGFDLDDKARRQLQDVARAGKGGYYDASNYHDLIAGLKSVVEGVWEQVKLAEPQRYRKPVQGGSGFDDAVTLPPGQYTLKAHLGKGQRTYFFVNTRRAQRGLLRLQLQARALRTGAGGKAREAKHGAASFAVTVYGPDRRKIGGRFSRVGGKIGKTGLTHYHDIRGEGFYFTVGSQYNPVHRDALFSLAVQEAGDRYNGQVAPQQPRDGAMDIPAGEEIAAHLGLEDRGDTFAVAVPAGTSRVQLALRFARTDFRFTVEQYSADGRRRVKKFTGLKGSARLVLPVEADAKRLVFRVRDNNPSLNQVFSSYRFTARPMGP